MSDPTLLAASIAAAYEPPAPVSGKYCDKHPTVYVVDRDTCAACSAEWQRHWRCVECSEASIPKRYQWATVAGALLGARVAFDDPPARAIDNALNSERVVILGRAGSGKTSLGVALMRAWEAKLTPLADEILFISSRALARVRAGYPLGQGEPELVDRACDAALVLIDDLGSEPPLLSSAVTDIIEHRYNDMRPWIVTTGFDRKTLAATYGGGIARRLLEGAYVIELGTRA